MGGGGKWFGDMGSNKGPLQKGIVSYQLSPNHQRVFANAFRKGVFNVFRRTSAQAFYVVPGALLFYFTVTMGNKRHAYINSKAGAHLREA
ncbi:ubiquinol-cytochrome c oxidoreductase subunit [Syncephalis fuscata]|nr:ubiquinol-cytochrome c oxidoreductase subunit [Syncephalis fuscata]